MAAPMELFCWAGGWGLPSVDPDCLAVLTYARFTGAPLRVHKVTNPWRSPSGCLPALKTKEEGVLSQMHQIITHLRKQQYNADSDLSARQGADTLAFVSLLEEKLLPVLIHTFWVDTKNYVEHTRKWYTEAIPFPLNFFLPNRMHKQHLERLQLIWGESCLEDEEELEKEMYREAQECLTLLSQRLGDQKFFFGDSPASLDAFVFSHLGPLLKAKLPNGKLQQHLKSLQNLCDFCSSILSLYFPWDGGDAPSSAPKTSASEGTESEEEPYKRRKQILSVLVGLAAMIGYAFLSGIVSIQRGPPGAAGPRPIALEEEEEEEEEDHGLSQPRGPSCFSLSRRLIASMAHLWAPSVPPYLLRKSSQDQRVGDLSDNLFMLASISFSRQPEAWFAVAVLHAEPCSELAMVMLRAFPTR
uniref:Metaxin-1 n=1 Tax=Gopherus evgoodei TaxID=1825980 RepID=A0A8C4Y218_9SAUR